VSKLQRLTPTEAVARYVRRPKNVALVHYAPELHLEEMKAVCTGVVGALLSGKADDTHSISGPQVGSRIPVVGTLVPGDVIRIFVDPYVDTYGGKVQTGYTHIRVAEKHVILTYYTYQGEASIMDTGRMDYTNHTGLSLELQYQARLLASLPREVTV
jgi:hypothetical protein